MLLQTRLTLICLSIIILLGGCTLPNVNLTPAVDQPITATETQIVISDVPEQSVQMLQLTGPLSQRDAEISAMAWYGDILILVPQFPRKYQNSLYMLTKSEINAFLDGTSSDPLAPAPIPLDAGTLHRDIYRYQGFEAIGFRGDEVFLTIEAGGRNETLSYLVRGTIAPDLSQIVLDTTNVTEILPQAAMGNTGDETLVVTGDQLLTIYEANGINVNTLPIAHVFGTDLSAQGVMRFPNIEYRITDATAIDERGIFWAINYFFPGDEAKYQPFRPESIALTFGAGASHAKLQTVERLVEFQLGENGIELTGRPPIQLKLIGSELVLLGQSVGDQVARNWEGIVRLDDRGFLIVTDKFPETLLGFVVMP